MDGFNEAFHRMGNQLGFSLTKGLAQSDINQGQYRVREIKTRLIVLGARYDASINDVVAFIAEKARRAA